MNADLDQEAVRVIPRDEHIAHDVANALLPEAELLATNDGRVDKIHTKCICTVSVDDYLGVRVVLEPFGHLLAVLD